MDLHLRDRCVVITGASGGIGRALAREFAGEGARLVLHGHSRLESLERFARGLAPADRVLVHDGDVRSAADCDALLEAARSRFGRVDACVANAGVWPAGDAPLHHMDEARIRAVLEVNLLGALFTARAFLRALAASGPRGDGTGAAQVLIGSTAGAFGERGHAEYAVSKAGLRGLLLSVKNEIVRLDPQARINLVEPGWTVTEMTREHLQDDAALRRALATMALRRVATPADVARVVAFLASPAAAHVTGQTITVAGGMEGRVLWADLDLDPPAVRRAAENSPEGT